MYAFISLRCSLELGDCKMYILGVLYGERGSVNLAVAKNYSFFSFSFFFHLSFLFPGYVVAIVMTKKIPVMCTCPNVLLQWF